MCWPINTMPCKQLLFEYLSGHRLRLEYVYNEYMCVYNTHKIIFSQVTKVHKYRHNITNMKANLNWIFTLIMLMYGQQYVTYKGNMLQYVFTL